MPKKNQKAQKYVKAISILKNMKRICPEAYSNALLKEVFDQKEKEFLDKLFEIMNQDNMKKSSGNLAQKKEGAKVINPGS